MWKKNKEKPIKLGQIRDEKLEKFSDSITWDFDITMLIFIRDGLKRFKQVNNGIPQRIFQKHDHECWAVKEWDDIIQKIIDDIDYYLLDEQSLLDKSDQDLLHTYYQENHIISRQENKDGSVTVEYAEMPAYIKAIYERIREISKQQEEKLSEAFDLIKEWHADFWW